MEEMRFQIVFDKLKEDEILAEVAVDNLIEENEAEEIAELRRIVIETTAPDPCFFSST